jgi:Na+-translocating ferredoxin:NAD+ oxidoreductase RNF subunit RnfB
MSTQSFYHALKVDTQVCFGCTHCMIKCPTGAIRINDGIAEIRQNWCVDCGECMKACPVDAIYIEQEDFNNIFAFKHRVVLLPSVFIGEFSKYIKEEEIFAVLYELGFTHVFQVEHSASVILDAMREMAATKSDKPHISPFCPAIVRLIQIKFPSLVDNIMPIKPPIDATALFYRSMLENQGIAPKDIGLFYVTPCAAKIAAVRAPVGEETSPINGVINMDFLYNKVYHIFKQRPLAERGSGIEVPQLSSTDMLWSLTNGEADHMQGRCLAIDEIHNVIDFLERMETTDEIQNVDFLELRACDQSCAGGILLSGNRFLTMERLNKRAQSIQEKPFLSAPELEKPLAYLKNNIIIEDIQPRAMQPFGSDMGEALKKMQQVRNLMCYLPGIDCGACGAPNCQALAEDIARREAQLSNCVFLQRTMEKHKKLSSDHAIRLIEKTWGKDRLDKDCKKKGAKYEGS